MRWTLNRRNSSPFSVAAGSSRIWANVVLCINPHDRSDEHATFDRVLEALENRPAWTGLGAVGGDRDGSITERVPAEHPPQHGRSVDDLRRATCEVLLAAGIGATVTVHEEWMVWAG